MKHDSYDASAKQPRTPRQIRLSTFIFALILVLVVGVIIGTRSQQIMAYLGPIVGIHSDNSTLDLSTTEDVYHLLKENYDGNVDTSKLEDGAATGLTDALGDPFTVFMTAKEATQFSDTLNGKVSGIGAEIGVRDNQPTILRLVDNSPAASSGLKIGDQITTVDGKTTVDKDANTTANLIRGDEGTTVKIVVKRGSESHTFDIKRANVQDPSVRGAMNGTTGVITITRFDSDTGDLARRVADKLKSQGAKSVILDLRDNGGGELDQTGLVAGLWLDSGKTVVTVRHGDTIQQTVTASGDPILKGLPTVILMNDNTASASEITIGALTDYKVATTLGEKSYGKGSVQQLFPLDSGAELKVTIAKWYTPNGQNINHTGFEPNKKVELTSAEQNKGQDPQLDAALKELQK